MTSTQHRTHPLTIAAVIVLVVGLAVAVILVVAPAGETTDLGARRGLAFVIGAVAVIAAGVLALIPGANGDRE